MMPFLVSTAVRTCSGLATWHIYGHSTEGAFLIDGTASRISLSQRSALIYASGRCDLALALPTTSLVETPCGHFHHYLASQWAKASERSTHTCAHTLPSHHAHTGSMLEGTWTSHCRHSERISHPEGSAAWWARGVSGSVSVPNEELVWLCTHAHIHKCKHAHIYPFCVKYEGFANLEFTILVCSSGSSWRGHFF